MQNTRCWTLAFLLVVATASFAFAAPIEPVHTASGPAIPSLEAWMSGAGSVEAMSFTLPSGDASREDGLAGKDAGLSGDLEANTDHPIVAEPSAGESLLLPILAIVLAGAVWRFYTSPEYRELYDRLYGPLNQY